MGSLVYKNVGKIYQGGVRAVSGFSLDVKEGEFIVLVGPSGCGKSTILRMTAGLESISEGELLIDGQVVNSKPPIERDISVVFQDYALYPQLSVYDNVGMSLKLRHTDEGKIFDKVLETSQFLEIKDYLARLPGQLSGGQKQRVSLGRAIARAPKVFLMDEPLSNLDAKLRVHTRSEIVRVQRALGVTTLYVTHDQTEAMTMADRIVVINMGIVQQIGTPLEIYQKPANIFVAGFIGMPPMNFLEGKIEDCSFKSEALGSSHTLPMGYSKYNGKKVVLGVRSEAIAIGDEGVELPVRNVEFLGSNYNVFLQYGDKILIASVNSFDPSKKTAKVKMDEHRVHLFDAETTMRLEI